MYPHTTRKVSELIPYANNARTHSDTQIQQIASSIKEFGFTNPLLIDEKNGIIAGHGRLLAARLVGHEEVPCILIDQLTEAQKKALVIADNKLALNAGWDEKLLSLEIQTLADMEFDIGLLGFEGEELDKLLSGDLKAGKTDDDAVPDITDKPVTNPGDIWILGQHRLICGDGTEKSTIEALLDGDLADLYLTDPPYNLDYTGKTSDSLEIKNDTMSDVEFRDFLKGAFGAAGHFMKPGAVFYIWHADVETYNFCGAVKDVGLEMRQMLIWKKQHFVMGRKDYQVMHEPCLYGWKPGAKHLWASDRKQTTILSFDRPMRSAEHPTMKPVELFLYQLLNNTKGKDIVLDNFCGSGTTVIACEKSDRKARAVELDPCYCDVIIARWEDYTGEKAIHAETGVEFRRGTRSKGKKNTPKTAGEQEEGAKDVA